MVQASACADDGTAAQADRFTSVGGPWHRVDGVPLTETAEAFLAGERLLAPIAFRASGPVNLSNSLWSSPYAPNVTVTSADAAKTCNFYTDGAGQGSTGTYASSTRVGPWYPYDTQGTFSCGNFGLVICLEE